MDTGPHPRRKALELLVIVALGVTFISLEPVRGLLDSVLRAASPMMTAHPVGGRLLFVLLSILSAMVAFVSSAVVVPVAVFAWGPIETAAMLWLAWLAGGATSWLIGRTLGRKVASRFISPERLDYYAGRLGARTGFATVLLFQLAVPSEVPGYVLGTVGYPFRWYLLALALGELPFAIGAVGLGDSVLQGDRRTLITLGLIGAAFSIVAMVRLRRRMQD